MLDLAEAQLLNELCLVPLLQQSDRSVAVSPLSFYGHLQGVQCEAIEVRFWPTKGLYLLHAVAFHTTAGVIYPPCVTIQGGCRLRR